MTQHSLLLVLFSAFLLQPAAARSETKAPKPPMTEKTNTNSPAAVKPQTEFIVNPGVEGSYNSINDAIQAAPANSQTEIIIYIHDGEYHEKVIVDRPHITLMGQSRKGTRIIHPILARIWSAEHPDKGQYRASLCILSRASDCTLINLTVINNYGSTIEQTNHHQFAVIGYATRTITLNCDFISDGSDTLSLWDSENGMYYNADCYISSTGVDFVCPRGWCYMERCELFSRGRSAQVWHNGRDVQDKKFVLRDCSFGSEQSCPLGRYSIDAQMYFLNCTFGKNIADKAVQFTGTEEEKATRVLWGHRVYYNDCKRTDGELFAWAKNNLESAAGSPTDEQITPLWTFAGKWDPMPKAGELKKYYN